MDFEVSQAKIIQSLLAYMQYVHVCTNVHSLTLMPALTVKVQPCERLTKHKWRVYYIMPWFEHVIKAMPGRWGAASPPPPSPFSLLTPSPPCQQGILGAVPSSHLHLITRGSTWPAASRWHSIKVFHFPSFAPPPRLCCCSRCHLIIILNILAFRREALH